MRHAAALGKSHSTSNINSKGKNTKVASKSHKKHNFEAFVWLGWRNLGAILVSPAVGGKIFPWPAGDR